MTKYTNGASTITITSRVSVVINHKQRTISKLKDGIAIDKFNYPEGYTCSLLSQLVDSVKRDSKGL